MSRLFAAPRSLSLARRAPPAARRSVFTPAAAPPRLASAEQAEFERLQRASRGAFSNSGGNAQSPPPDPPTHEQQQQVAQSPGSVVDAAAAAADELHQDVRRGAEPEFDGDVNPATGEIGGPKNEPLRWGGSGDWSYNGRVTDF